MIILSLQKCFFLKRAETPASGTNTGDWILSRLASIKCPCRTSLEFCTSIVHFISFPQYYIQCKLGHFISNSGNRSIGLTILEFDRITGNLLPYLPKIVPIALDGIGWKILITS